MKFSAKIIAQKSLHEALESYQQLIKSLAENRNFIPVFWKNISARIMFQIKLLAKKQPVRPANRPIDLTLISVMIRSISHGYKLPVWTRHFHLLRYFSYVFH